MPTEEPGLGLDLKSKFREAATLYAQAVKNDPRLEATTAYVRVRPLATLRRTWADVI